MEIKYDSKKGLLLQWNFKDLANGPNYYHHLFIILHSHPPPILPLLELYYKKMKQGDLIAVVYFHSKDGPKFTTWLEKTHLTHFQPSKVAERMGKESLRSDQVDELIRLAA